MLLYDSRYFQAPQKWAVMQTPALNISFLALSIYFFETKISNTFFFCLGKEQQSWLLSWKALWTIHDCWYVHYYNR